MIIRQWVFVWAWVACSVASGQTNWLPPVTVASAAGTSSTRLIKPVVAAGPDGTVAAVWTGHGGTNNNTGSYAITREKHSHVYFSNSRDGGTSWSTPKVISDPRVLSSQVRIAPGLAGEFNCTWTSGDALSGFRLHTASTTDFGDTFTSHTWLQGDDEPTMGYREPGIAVSGANRILVHNGNSQDTPTRRGRVTVSTQTLEASDWSDVEIQGLPEEESLSTFNGGSIAASGADVIVPIQVSYSDAGSPGGFNRHVSVLVSRNWGMEWQTNDVPTSFPAPTSTPVIAHAAGTWFMFWMAGLSSQVSVVQKSTDAGATWSEAQFLPSAYRVNSAASDGNGRWLVTLLDFTMNPIKYVWSDDDGGTWSGLTSIPGTSTTVPGETIVYEGNGRWTVAWADALGTVVKASTLLWGPSTVDEWQLY